MSNKSNRKIVVKENGSIFYYRNNQLHRIDGPAYIGADGFEEYRKNGTLHNIDGPVQIEILSRVIRYCKCYKNNITEDRVFQINSKGQILYHLPLTAAEKTKLNFMSLINK